MVIANIEMTHTNTHAHARTHTHTHIYTYYIISLRMLIHIVNYCIREKTS